MPPREGLTPNRAAVLDAVVQLGSEDVTRRRISETARIDDRGLVRVLQDLQALGWLSHRRKSEAHNAPSLYTLTTAGEKARSQPYVRGPGSRGDKGNKG